jgi:hypothetical protein
VPCARSARRFDRRGAVIGREPRRRREPGGIADVGEDQSRDDRSDTVELDQRGVRLLDRVSDAGLDRGEVAIEAAHVGEEIGSQLLAFASHETIGAHDAQELRRPIGRQSPGCPAGDELAQHRMQPTRCLRPQRDQVVVAAGQQPEHVE